MNTDLIESPPGVVVAQSSRKPVVLTGRGYTTDGKYTVDIPDIPALTGGSRQWAYEATKPGGVLHDGVIELGAKRKVVSARFLEQFLRIPMPADDRKQVEA